MLSIGIDPSLSCTGVVIIDAESGEAVSSDTVSSSPKESDERRIVRIASAVEDIVAKASSAGRPMGAIEGIAFMAKNTSALAQLSGLHYYLRIRLADALGPFFLVTPTSLKKFVTGTGNCKKDLVLLSVYKNFGREFSDDNLADAFGLAAFAAAASDCWPFGRKKFQEEAVKKAVMLSM